MTVVRVWVHAERTHAYTFVIKVRQANKHTYTRIHMLTCVDKRKLTCINEWVYWILMYIVCMKEAALYRCTSFFFLLNAFLLLLLSRYDFFLFEDKKNVKTTSYGIPFTTRATIKSHTLTSTYELYIFSYTHTQRNTNNSTRCHVTFVVLSSFLNYIQKISVISAVGDIMYIVKLNA